MLEIKNLSARINGNDILRGITLNIRPGEVHAIMGPNGSGKSTLAKVLAGHPSYEVTDGIVRYKINGRFVDLFSLQAHERAREGVFLSYQYPVEIPGVTNAIFLRESFNEICRHQGAEELDPYEFDELLQEKLKPLQMDVSFISRPVNEGFSGGEKKKNEILQMSVLSPKLAILDETDSGLDIDALKIVTTGINTMRSPDRAILLVTHYQRLLDYVVPDFVHVLYQGRIIKSGGKELALSLEEQGYDWAITGERAR
jgi:Fe-S cluster assembly ATP-binding protein